MGFGAWPRLYLHLISISLPRDPRLEADQDPPRPAGWRPKACHCRFRIPLGGRRPGPDVEGSQEPGFGVARCPAAHLPPLAPSSACACKVSPSQAGEATYPCPVPTPREPSPSARRRRPLWLGKKFAKAGWSIGGAGTSALSSPLQARAPLGGFKLAVPSPATNLPLDPG